MTQDKKKHQKQLNSVIGLIFGVLLLLVAVKAIYIQAFRDKWLTGKGVTQYERLLVTKGRRGTISDANYQEMAVSLDVSSIAAFPAKIKNKRETASALAGILKISKKALYQKLACGKKFVWIKRKASASDIKNVRKLGIKGLDYINEESRVYPNNTMAAQVIGFTGIDNNGLEGVEFYYNKFLEGDTDKTTYIRDAIGRIIIAKDKKKMEKDSGYNDGNNIILTIDSRIQHIAEYALKESVEKFSAKSGMAVVMVPKTGAILAIAHFPFFNPNNYNKYNRQLWRNRAVTDSFEPGSTMKIFTAASALQTEKCIPDTIFFCENGTYKIGRRTVHDTHEHGWLSLQQIIKHSSNIGAVKIIETIGRENLYNTLRNFGFGKKTEIDSPGETSGQLAYFKKWRKIDSGTIAFGQGIAVSAVQLLTAVSAIANDGILMKPYVVQAITDHNGGLIQNFAPEKIRRAISQKNAERITKMMQSVISEDGTGFNAAVKEYSACGKTGTAQKINKYGKYSNNKYIASFVGFAPVNKPEIAILVAVNEPEKEHYGGTVAAPVFRIIAYKSLDYLNIHPDGLLCSRNILNAVSVSR